VPGRCSGGIGLIQEIAAGTPGKMRKAGGTATPPVDPWMPETPGRSEDRGEMAEEPQPEAAPMGKNTPTLKSGIHPSGRQFSVTWGLRTARPAVAPDQFHTTTESCRPPRRQGKGLRSRLSAVNSQIIQPFKASIFSRTLLYHILRQKTMKTAKT